MAFLWRVVRPASDAASRVAVRLRQAFERASDAVTPLFVTVVAGGLAVGLSLVIRRSLAHCPPPPSLFSIELTFSAKRLAQLKALAGPCGGVLERSFVQWDLLFPWLYAAALGALLVWAERWQWTAVDGRVDEAALADPGSSGRERLAGFMVVAPWLAAALDVFGENLPLWLAWDRLGPPPTLMAGVLVWLGSFAAAIKWSLIGATIIWLVVLLLSGPRRWVVWRVRFSALAVLLGSVPLLVIPQGQNVIANIAETRANRGLLPGVAGLLLGALAAWWCARVLIMLRLPREERPTGDWEAYFEREIPRILGVAVLVLGAAALARAAGEGVLQGFAIGGLVSLVVTGVLRRWFGTRLEGMGIALLRATPWNLAAISGLACDVAQGLLMLVIFIPVMFVMPATNSRDPVHQAAAAALRCSVVLTVVLAVACYIWAYHRRKIAAVMDGTPLAEADAELLAGYPPSAIPRRTIRTAKAGGFASALCFVTFLYHDTVTIGQLLGAFVILCLAAANAVLIGSVTVVVGRVLRVPVVTIALAMAVVFSAWNDNHAVHLVDPPRPDSLRPTLGRYYGEWVRARWSGTQGDTVPVVLVAAAGGGLRAAYWTAHALSVLSDRDTAFGRAIFAISGVSGGSLGGATYAALVRDRALGGTGPCFRAGGDTALTHCSHVALSGDFLSPVLARLVATDFTQFFIPIRWPLLDRSRALEASWTTAYRNATSDSTFAAGFQSLWLADSVERRMPALLLNATHVETGRRVVASPFRLEGVLHDGYDLSSLLRADVRLAGAVHNSARFAYVSPAGTLVDSSGRLMGHAVDGGYFENSGLATVGDLYAALDRVGGLDSIPRRYVVVYLCNDPVGCALQRAPAMPRAVESGLVNEWAAPLRALLDTREARGGLARAEVEVAARAPVGRPLEFHELDVCADSVFNSTSDSTAAERVRSPPLGWLLSPSARRVIEQSLSGDAGCRKANRAAVDSVLRAVRPRR